jgi:hypothetical protein
MGGEAHAVGGRGTFTWILATATIASVLIGVAFMPRPKDTVIKGAGSMRSPSVV